MSLFELLFGVSAMGLSTAYLAHLAFFSEAKKEKKVEKEKMVYTPLTGPLLHRLVSLKRIAEMGAPIGFSTPEMRLHTTETNEGVQYSFHSFYCPQPLLTFFFHKESKSIQHVKMDLLDPTHPEVKAVLEQVKNKVLRHHGVDNRLVTSIASSDDAREKYNELVLRMDRLLGHSMLHEAEQMEISNTILPMTHEAMNQYKECDEQMKAKYTSKVLDIFYYLEKRIHVFEISVKQKSQKELDDAFAEMEKQAQSLIKGNE